MKIKLLLIILLSSTSLIASAQGPVITPGTYSDHCGTYNLQDYPTGVNEVCAQYGNAPFQISNIWSTSQVYTQLIYASDPELENDIWWQGGWLNGVYIIQPCFFSCGQMYILRVTASTIYGTVTYDVAFKSTDC